MSRDTLKVCIRPRADSIDEISGIGRVVHAQNRYLPKYDIELTDNPREAQLFAGHTQQFDFPARYDDPPFVLHLHGAYWTAEEGVYGNYARLANTAISNAIRRANHVTVPAEWVGMFVKRDCRISPTVIGHGIDLEEWSPTYPIENEGYIFWGKNRAADVCNPKWAYELAKMGNRVISTFAPERSVRLPNLDVVGRLDAAMMKDRLQHADIYLATTKETFGITTIEAMACGIPILGFDFGGTKDIVRHRVDGYLARPYDLKDLVKGLEFIREHRRELSINARERAKDFAWDRIIPQYAELYRRVYEQSVHRTIGVSVVITNHNYKDYVGSAIDSVIAQEYPVEDIIVVDDGSSDDSVDTIDQIAKEHPSIRVITQTNQGVAAARNNGIAAATQPFIICLDADDLLDKRYVQSCFDKLMSDRGLGITYTGLIPFSENGANSPIYTPFDWDLQSKGGIPPATCIPCAAMFRKEMWERVGGYKQKYAPAEDTEFWVRGLASGFSCEGATKDGLFYYRVHEGSASRTLRYGAIDNDKPYLRDKQFPFAAPSKVVPLIRSYSEPIIDVIIDVQHGQEGYIHSAVDSVLGQTIREWNIFVKNSVGLQSTYPFITNVNPSQDAKMNAPLWIFVPADNELLPQAIERYASAIIQQRVLKPEEIYKYPERINMANCCGGNGNSILDAKRALGLIPQERKTITLESGMIKMRYTGDRKGTTTIVSPISGRRYAAADNDDERNLEVMPQDVNFLLSTGFFVLDTEPITAVEAMQLPSERSELENLYRMDKRDADIQHAPIDKAPYYQIDQSAPVPEDMRVDTERTENIELSSEIESWIESQVELEVEPKVESQVKPQAKKPRAKRTSKK